MVHTSRKEYNMKTIQEKSEELFDLLQSGQITKEYADSQMSKYETLTRILSGEITSIDADLRGVDLSGANLSRADLSRADLSSAYLSSADLSDIISDYSTIGYHLACQEEGSFIAWKKVDDCMIKLEIPADAKRSSATTLKCRCSYAKVLEIECEESALISTVNSIVHIKYGHNTVYSVGEYVYPDSYDEDRWNECSNGIHFFMNKECARRYS